MPGIIDALLKLQEIQLELFELRQEEVTREKRIALHRKELEKIDARLAQLDQQIRDHQTQHSLTELDLKTRQENIARHREALKQIRTNKEYNAILTTLNTEEVDKTRTEQRIIEGIGLMEQLRAQREQIVNERQAELDRIALIEDNLSKYRAKVAPRRSELEQRKREACEGIPAPSLTTFERVAERHEGEALAQVVRVHPKRDEYCCGGCNMKITLEIVNALGSRSDIQFCASCGRILYLR